MKPKKCLSKYKKEMMLEFLIDIGAFYKYIFYIKKINSEVGMANIYQSVNDFNLLNFNWFKTIEGYNYWQLIFHASITLNFILYNFKELTDDDIDERINLFKHSQMFQYMEKKQKTLTDNIIKYITNKFKNNIRKYYMM